MISKSGVKFTDTIRIVGNGVLDEIRLFNYADDESKVKALAIHLPARSNSPGE